MTPIIAVACFILNIVPVTGCDPAGQWYVQQAQQIPPAHLRMVASITLWDQPNGDSGYPSRTIRLPATEHWDPTVMAHESGHVVAGVLGLNRPWEDTFWRDGAAVGLTTPYGRSAPTEDIAETYAAIVTGRLGECSAERVSWLRERAGL